MKLIRKTYTTRREKIIDFTVGFVGMIVINALMFAGVAFITPKLNDAGTVGVVLALFFAVLPFIINIFLLILFSFTRHWIAIGMLGIFVLGVALTLLAGVLFAVVCFANLAYLLSQPFRLR